MSADRTDEDRMDLALSVCIPTFNRAGLLRRGLRQLVPQCAGRAVEICVSNNASQDETEFVLAQWPVVKCVTQPTNTGIDRNTLAALRMASGRYVLPIGDDELVDPCGLDLILEALKSGPDMLILNGRRRGACRLPAELRGRILRDCVEGFALLWDQMPLGGFVIRREAVAAAYAERFLGTHHAYSGAAWEYLAGVASPRIECMAEPTVEFIDVPKTWAADADAIRRIEIPRWFDLMPDVYSEAVSAARVAYLRTWGKPPFYEGLLTRVSSWAARLA